VNSYYYFRSISFIYFFLHHGNRKVDLWLNFVAGNRIFNWMWPENPEWSWQGMDNRQPVWPAATPAADQLPGLRAPPEDAYRTLERLSPMPPGRKVTES
jgi:hypothetical protein